MLFERAVWVGQVRGPERGTQTHDRGAEVEAATRAHEVDATGAQLVEPIPIAERMFDHVHGDTMRRACDSYPPWRVTFTTRTGRPPVRFLTIITICALSWPLQVQISEPAAPSQPWKVYKSVGPAFVWSG